jgi:hypothetical protein
MDFTVLKSFVDLGGVFILALLMFYLLDRKTSVLDDKLDKILALLVVLTRAHTDFNHVDKLLGDQSEKVNEIITAAKNPPV